MISFIDRVDAGRRLAAKVVSALPARDVVVLGLPRGGVPVAFEVAKAMSAPLDVLVVRKLGVPYHPELAMGAVGEGGVRVMNARVLASIRVEPDALAAVERTERRQLARRLEQYRRSRPAVRLKGRTVVIVDDGVATGATAQAACRIARKREPAKVVFAAPIASREAVAILKAEADDVLCVDVEADFVSVGQFYADFSPTPDDEVVRLLELAARRPAGQAS